jgi:hypothetical protein
MVARPKETKCGSPVVPGFSLHEELGYFVQAGLTPYEALKAATGDPARFLHREEEFGTVEQLEGVPTFYSWPRTLSKMFITLQNGLE